MNGGLGSRLPSRQLRALEFLIGECSGPGVIYHSGKLPVHFTGYLRGEREQCERYLRLDFFAMVPGVGPESVHSLTTFNEKLDCYEMWCFLGDSGEPMRLQGEMQGKKLVLVSDPTQMQSGMQKLRVTFSPRGENAIDFNAEAWTLDGYVPFIHTMYRDSSVPVGD